MTSKKVYKFALALIFSLSISIFPLQATSVSSPQTFLQLPLVRQSTDYTCGAAAALSILGYFGENNLESEIAKELGTKPSIGTHHQKMISFFKSKNFQVEAHSEMSIEELKAFIKQGKPVLCLIQAWEDDVTDYSNYWGIGHYVVAIGYDNQNIYFMDPWVLGQYTYLPQDEFINRWHQLTSDNMHLIHWGMAVSKSKVAPSEKFLYMQ